MENKHILKCFFLSDQDTNSTLSKFGTNHSMEIVGVSTTLTDILFNVIAAKPELLYIDLAKCLPNEQEFNLLKQTCSLVLLADSEGDAYRAFELQAFDYIIKPVDYTHFARSVNKYQTFLAKLPTVLSPTYFSDSFFIKVGHNGLKEMMFQYSDVLYIEAAQNYILLYTVDGARYISYHTLKEMEGYLPEIFFSRVHKSFIINDTKIKLIDGNIIHLDSTSEIKILIGNSYKKSFKEKRGGRMLHVLKSQMLKKI